VRILGYQGPSGVQPLPVYGAIHAGEPSLLPEHRTSYLSIDRRFVPGEDTFALRVVGDSMIGRGIHDGDYVLVHPSSAARDGDIVAARIGVEATIKTIDSRDGRTVLVPAHPDERELVIDEATDFAVLGVCAACSARCSTARASTSRSPPRRRSRPEATPPADQGGAAPAGMTGAGASPAPAKAARARSCSSIRCRRSRSLRARSCLTASRNWSSFISRSEWIAMSARMAACRRLYSACGALWPAARLRWKLSESSASTALGTFTRPRWMFCPSMPHLPPGPFIVQSPGWRCVAASACARAIESRTGANRSARTLSARCLGVR
jgi:hypothetical protein